MHCLQKAQLHDDSEQEKAGEKAGSEEVLQVVQSICLA
jgi:hypothetical protein